MLIDEIKASTNLREKYLKSSNSDKVLKTLKYMDDELKNYKSQIIELFEKSTDLKSINHNEFISVSRLLSHLKKMRESIDSIEKEGAKDYVIELKNCIDQSYKDLERIWKVYTKEKYEPNKALVEAIAELIDNNGLQKLYSLKYSIESKKIGDADTITKVNKYSEISKKLIKDLKIKPSIEKFIIELSQGTELHLNDISEETMQWLIDQKITSKIIVSI